MNINDPQVVSLYKIYQEVINPLIIEIETMKTEFPVSALNEIRSFTCHISRALNENSGVDPQKEIEKAEGHLERVLLDCYKTLIILLDDKCVGKFSKDTKNIDLTFVNNGDFIPRYNNCNKVAQDALMKAKRLDADSGKKLEALNLYQEALIRYREFESFLDDASNGINWARKAKIKKKIKNIIWGVLAWLGSAILSGIVSSMWLDFNAVKEWFGSIFSFS
jgi:hypothetical protein